MIKPLAQNHHVIAIDEVGFGHSDKPFIDYRIQTFVDFLGEFLRIKGVKHFALAGEATVNILRQSRRLYCVSRSKRLL